MNSVDFFRAMSKHALVFLSVLETEGSDFLLSHFARCMRSSWKQRDHNGTHCRVNDSDELLPIDRVQEASRHDTAAGGVVRRR